MINLFPGALFPGSLFPSSIFPRIKSPQQVAPLPSGASAIVTIQAGEVDADMTLVQE